MEKETFQLIINTEVEGRGSALNKLHSIAQQINKGFVHGEDWELASNHPEGGALGGSTVEEDDDENKTPAQDDQILSQDTQTGPNDAIVEPDNKTPESVPVASQEVQNEPNQDNGGKNRRPWWGGGTKNNAEQ